jgi:hypothetical protein
MGRSRLAPDRNLAMPGQLLQADVDLVVMSAAGTMTFTAENMRRMLAPAVGPRA